MTARTCIPTTAFRCVWWCPSCTAGRARSGCARLNLRSTIGAASGKFAVTIITATRGPRSVIPSRKNPKTEGLVSIEVERLKAPLRRDRGEFRWGCMRAVEVSPSAAKEISRAEQVERLRSESFDLAVIGGGINGAAIARDAAMRGMQVAL